MDWISSRANCAARSGPTPKRDATGFAKGEGDSDFGPVIGPHDTSHPMKDQISNGEFGLGRKWELSSQDLLLFLRCGFHLPEDHAVISPPCLHKLFVASALDDAPVLHQ